jgi:hypothetical protein
MADTCPQCDREYSRRVRLELGDRFGDVFGRTPLGLVSQYVRICTDPEEATRATRKPTGGLDVYLHEASDLGRGGAAFA